MDKSRLPILRLWHKRYTVVLLSTLFLGVGIYIAENSINTTQKTNNIKTKFFSSSPFLSESDKVLYKKIFAFQKSANWQEADKAISELESDVLLGDVLAERYLHRHYDTEKSEIEIWLKNYADHAQTGEMIKLAAIKYPEIKKNLPEVKTTKKLNGYGDNNAKEIRFDNNPVLEKLWESGIEAWRAGKHQKSADLFSSIAGNNSNDLTRWQYSAANFWAYRSYQAIGEKTKANIHLKRAAENPRVFYGIIARKKLEMSLELDKKPVNDTKTYSKELLQKPEIQRIIALSQAGLNERADNQIRQLFLKLNKKEKWELLTLAQSLNLASVQISMAKILSGKERELDSFKYPIPKWKPESGFNLEPSLIYALMRQESGFRSSAVSSNGALGLMQLMPKTARKMHSSSESTSEINHNFSEPVLNVTLGERYVAHLLNNKLVGGNLFYMLAAYNAGIGRLKEWQSNITYNDDPLLFIESIPYSETRTYVMQVMANYWIYNDLLEIKDNSVIALLKNNWPVYPLSNAIETVRIKKPVITGS